MSIEGREGTTDGGMGDGLDDNLEPISIEENDDVEINEPAKPESLRETLKRSMQELKDEQPDGEVIPEPVQKVEVKPIIKQAEHSNKNNVNRSNKEIDPPGSYKLEEKEDFNRLPPKQKEAVKRVVNGYKAERDTFVNDFKQYKSQLDLRSKDIDVYEGLVKDHLPTWGAQGFTPIQAIAGLVKAQNQIINNPRQALKDLIASTGVTQEELFGNEENSSYSNNSVPDIENHPAYQKMAQELNYLRGSLEPVINSRREQEEAHFNSGVDEIVNEVNLVRNEKDSYGRYLYPKLHDNSFLESVNSLAFELRNRKADLKWSEAVKRAYSAIEGNQQPTSNITRPQTHSVVRSLGPQRGIGAGYLKPTSTNEPLKVGDSVRAALEQLKRGSF